MAHAGQRVPDRADHQAANGLGFAEPDLKLGGVDIHIHRCRIQLEEYATTGWRPAIRESA